MEKLSTSKSNSIIFTQEVNEIQVESFKKAKWLFQENEKKHLKEQIQDLQMSLDINKGIICDLLQCKSLSQVEGALINKLNDENALLRLRIKSIYYEMDEANAQTLLLQQICNELQLKETENGVLYEEQINEFKDKLERKEYFMQNKEKKWMEVEKILEEYVEEDDELREKLYDLRVNVYSNKKISNVVEENEKLKYKLDQAHDEIGRLRKQVLMIGCDIGKKQQINRKDGGLYSPKNINQQPRNIQKQKDQNPGEEDDNYDDEEQTGDDLENEQEKIQAKRAFMSTAPINFFKSGAQNSKLKIKESKAELKQYSHQLEEALAKTRQKYIEIEKDNEILNKTYLKQLKQGDRMQQALNKVKLMVQQLSISEGKLCVNCQSLKEMSELKRIIRERVFDVSNEGETTLEGLEMSFNKDENWKAKTRTIQTRGQNNTAVARSRQNPNQNSDKKSTSPFQKIKEHDMNRFSSIIPEEELDLKEDNYMVKSPYLKDILESNKISAIGMMGDGRKDSPFWEQDQMNEFHNSVKQNHQQFGQGGNQNPIRSRISSELNDQFRS